MQTTNFPKAEFLETLRLNPFWSSWVCFTETIRGRSGLSKRNIRRYFEKLVDKDDYAKIERAELINYLCELRGEREKV